MNPEEEAFWRGQVTQDLKRLDRDVSDVKKGVKEVSEGLSQMRRLIWVACGCIAFASALPVIKDFLSLIQ